jgi:hypothetical protein
MTHFTGCLKLFGFVLIMLSSLTPVVSGAEGPIIPSTGAISAILEKQDYSLALGNLEVKNLLRPGDRIDVLKNSSQSDRKISTTVLHNIEVSRVASQGPTIVLAVTPDDAKELDLLQKENNFSILILADAR